MVSMGANDAQFRESRFICPRPGLLLMFPGWLPHAVTPVDEGTKGAGRVAIVFNVKAEEFGPLGAVDRPFVRTNGAVEEAQASPRPSKSRRKPKSEL